MLDDKNGRFRSRFDSPPPPRDGVWSLAALSIAALCCSVLGARFLAEVVERSDAPLIAANRAEQTLRRPVASGQSDAPVTIVRSVGVDGMTTATIPARTGVKLDPCGKEAK